MSQKGRTIAAYDTAPMERLMALDEPTRQDIFMRGMGGSVANIEQYFEEIEDCRKADARLKEIDENISKMPEKDRARRFTKLAKQKDKSLGSELHPLVPRHTLLDIENRSGNFAVVDTSNNEMLDSDAEFEGAAAKLAFISTEPKYDELVKA